MKTKLFTLFSLLALLLVSTAVLADGRPTGIRIGRAVSGGGANVEIDVTVSATNYWYYDGFYTVWLGAGINGGIFGPATWNARQYVNTSFITWLPYAIDWGDGNSSREVVLFGDGPWRGTFAHTYLVPGTYTITVGDAVCCSDADTAALSTGNAVTGSTRYVWTSNLSLSNSWTYNEPQLLAITANATVTTGTGIPALNVYGLLAMAFVLVGSGLLLYRKPQRTVA